MTRYFMTPITFNRFKTMEYDLNCRLCGDPIKPFDEVESKASGSGYYRDKVGPKLYHAECYDDAHKDVEYTEEYLQSVFDEEGMDGLQTIFWEFEEELPKGLSVDKLIEEILELEINWTVKNRNF